MLVTKVTAPFVIALAATSALAAPLHHSQHYDSSEYTAEGSSYGSIVPSHHHARAGGIMGMVNNVVGMFTKGAGKKAAASIATGAGKKAITGVAGKTVKTGLMGTIKGLSTKTKLMIAGGIGAGALGLGALALTQGSSTPVAGAAGASTECPTQNGDDTAAPLSDEIIASLKNRAATDGLSQWAEYMFLCYQPMPTAQWKAVQTIMKTAAVVSPSAGRAFTDDDLTNIVSTICQLPSETKGQYADLAAGFMTTSAAEKKTIAAAAAGTACPAAA